MSCSPAKGFSDAQKHIHTEIQSSDWQWNERICLLNFVIATITYTVSVPMAAAWSYD